MWVHSFFSSSCSKVCSLLFWCWFVFIQFKRSLSLTTIIWQAFLAVLKICLNSGRSWAGSAKFAGAFSTFWDFIGHCTMSLHLFYFFFNHGLSRIQKILFVFLRERKDIFMEEGKHALIWNFPFFLRICCSPRKWAMSMYVNFLTCETSLYGFILHYCFSSLA